MRHPALWLALVLAACSGSAANLGLTGDSGLTAGDSSGGDAMGSSSSGSSGGSSGSSSGSNGSSGGSGSGSGSSSGGSSSGSNGGDAAIMDSPPEAPSWCTIEFHDSQTAASYSATGPTTITISRPVGALAGDLLLAYIGGGDAAAKAAPLITAPAGWNLVRRSDYLTTGTLALYSRVIGVTEPSSYTWNVNQPFFYASWILAYGGADAAQPIDADQQQTIATAGTMFSTPGLITSGPDERIVATFAGHTTSATLPTWSNPSGMTGRVDLNNGQARSGASGDQLFSAQGTVGPFTSTASQTEDFALTDILAIRPCH